MSVLGKAKQNATQERNLKNDYEQIITFEAGVSCLWGIQNEFHGACDQVAAQELSLTDEYGPCEHCTKLYQSCKEKLQVKFQETYL